MKRQEPLRHKGDLYAAPKDRSSRVKIKILEQETPHYVSSGPENMELVHISRPEYYETEDGRKVSKVGDQFELDGIALYPLTEDELKNAGLS